MQATSSIIKTPHRGRKVANSFCEFSKFQKLRSSNKTRSRGKVAESKGDRAKARLLNRPRVRQYDPCTGRWLSKDPLLFGGHDTNLYGYALNDPINRVDLSGLDSESQQQCIKNAANAQSNANIALSDVHQEQIQSINAAITADQNNYNTTTSCVQKLADLKDEASQLAAETVNNAAYAAQLAKNAAVYHASVAGCKFAN